MGHEEHKKKIGIFGGTFNPLHTGHIKAAADAKAALGLFKIIFVPSRIPPHKDIPDGSPGPEKRCEMLKAALGHDPDFTVSDIELKRDGPSFTADTVREFKNIMPDCEFWLLIGSDMFLTLHEWSRAEWLLCEVRLGVFLRGAPHEEDMILRQKNILEEKYGAKTEIIRNKIIEISSSELRELLKRNEGAQYLPDGVYEYIKENNIYGIWK